VNWLKNLLSLAEKSNVEILNLIVCDSSEFSFSEHNEHWFEFLLSLFGRGEFARVDPFLGVKR
jgi:hypothetical protein